MDDSDLGICQQIRNLREGALPYWRPLYEARDQERQFLDGDRYENEDNLYNRDRRRQQFRGQEITNVNRHKSAQATATPRSIQARPVGRGSDADDAEIAVSILQWELGHPQKGFDDTLEEVIQDAIDCRAGAAMLDFDPTMGEFGETFWRWKDANLVMWEPGFADPHHLQCRWMQEARRMHIDDIKAMGKLKGKAKWYGTDKVVPDGDMTQRRQGATNPDGSPRLEGGLSGDNLLGVPGRPVDKNHVWVLFCWYKNDPSTYSRQSADEEIPPGQRYMGCNDPACMYRSKTQDELIAAGKLPRGGSLPADVPEPCPVCGTGKLERRDVRAKVQDVLTYPKGRRLVIMPLFQTLPDDTPFYDGAWPIPSARSFPILWITAYVKPGRPMGDSDTTRNWDAQQASDQLMTMAFDRIMRHQQYYALPRTGVYDHAGNRFEFRDDQYNVMFIDYSNTNVTPPNVQVIEGSALDSAWPGYWNAVQNVLLAHQGIADLGLTPDTSKNIAVGTVERLNQMGEIPVAHFIRRMNRALAKGYGVHWDYIRHTYTPARLARLEIDDEYVIDTLKGDDLANFDFIILETPPFSGLEKERAEAAQVLINMATTQPQWLDVFAEVNKLPPSIVRLVKRKLKEMEMAGQPAPAAPGAGAPGALPAAPPPGGAPLPAHGVMSSMLEQIAGPAALQEAA